MAEHSVHTFREPPRGARVAKALSKQEFYCKGKLNQTRKASASNWIDKVRCWNLPAACISSSRPRAEGRRDHAHRDLD
jgi:hypothetical protein